MLIIPQDLLVNLYNTSVAGWVDRYNGVRIYHKPTGIEVKCDEHKSQHRNKAECLRLLEEELCYLQKEEGEGMHEADLLMGAKYKGQIHDKQS